jgi:hypothetical protein
MDVTIYTPQVRVLSGQFQSHVGLRKHRLVLELREGHLAVARVALPQTSDPHRWSLTTDRSPDQPLSLVVVSQGLVIWGPRSVTPDSETAIDLTQLSPVTIRPTMGSLRRLHGWVRVVPSPAPRRQSFDYLVLDPARGTAFLPTIAPGLYEVLYYTTVGGAPAARSTPLRIDGESQQLDVELTS